MARVLVLGGTAWLGREVARRAALAGDDVTCLARGDSGSVADGVHLVAADRVRPDAYDALRGKPWDAVIDVSWQPAFVAGALDALSASTSHWTYVSSVSVYAHNDVPGEDEDAPTVAPLDAPRADLADYAAAKVACEDLVTAALGDRALLARAGLIAGPGDPTDRFGYWVGRLALAGGDPVLVPDVPGMPVQVIDVRDLADWIQSASAAGRTGAMNAVGPVLPFDDVLAMAGQAAGFTGDLVGADPAVLSAHGVQPWSGPRSLPLWLPMPENAGSMVRSGRRAVAAGLARRPLMQTLADTLDDERARGLGRDRHAGLTRVDELGILDYLAT